MSPDSLARDVREKVEEARKLLQPYREEVRPAEMPPLKLEPYVLETLLNLVDSFAPGPRAESIGDLVAHWRRDEVPRHLAKNTLRHCANELEALNVRLLAAKEGGAR